MLHEVENSLIWIRNTVLCFQNKNKQTNKIKHKKTKDFYQTMTKINNTLSLKHAIPYECNNGVHTSDFSHFLFAYLSSEQS